MKELEGQGTISAVAECAGARAATPETNRMHGGNLRAAAKRFGIRERDIIDFSSNVNPLGPSRGAVRAVKGSLGLLDRYPDPDAAELRTAISRYFGIRKDQVLCGAGSNALIHLIPRALRPRRALVPAPTFSEYAAAVEDSGGEAVLLPLREENGFRMDPVVISLALKGMDLAFLCNPNNPTGGILGRSEVMEIAERAGQEGTVLVVDEAFMDFDDRESVLKEIVGLPNVLCLRAFTKFFGLPGLRAGYAVGAEQLIAGLREKQEPWTVSIPAERAAVAALQDWGHIRKTRELIAREREWLVGELRLLPGVEVFPAAANFIMLKVTSVNPCLLINSLGERGILVRDCSSFPGLDARFLRIAVRTRRENRRFIKAIRSLLLG